MLLLTESAAAPGYVCFIIIDRCNRNDWLPFQCKGLLLDRVGEGSVGFFFGRVLKYSWNRRVHPPLGQTPQWVN